MKTPAITKILAMAALMASSAFAAADTTMTPAKPPNGAMSSAPEHPTKKQCQADAKAKKLTGNDKKQYVKDCLAGKAPA